MRQKTTKKVIAGVAAVLIGGLLVFAYLRRGAPREPVYVQEEKQEKKQKGHSHEHEKKTEQKQKTEQDDAGGQQKERRPSGRLEEGVRVVEMKAHQFAFEPSTVVVRSGEKVRLKVTSTDVTHGIAIEEYGVDQMLPPNETKEVTFTADEAGTYEFHCSVYCGSGHGDMTGQIVVKPASGGDGG